MVNYLKNASANGMLFFFFSISLPLFSQNTFIQVDAGYSFPISSCTLDETVSTYITDQQVVREEAVYFSLGEGFTFSATAGGIISPGLAAGMRVQHLITKDVHIVSESNIGSTLQVNNQIISSSIWAFSPELRLYVPDARISPFMTFGISFATGSIRKTEEIERQDIIFRKLWEYSGKFKVNPTASGGVLISLNEKLQLSLQCKICPMDYRPDKAVMTKATRDGTNNLMIYPTIEKEIHYVDVIETEYGIAPDPDKPENRMRRPWAAGGIQVVGGLVFLL
jgi:hypothetical protein